MTTQTAFFQCCELLDELLRSSKLTVLAPAVGGPVHSYFRKTDKIRTAVVLSTNLGESGPVIECWGIVYVDTDRPMRCTSKHMSFIHENVALCKLLEELTNYDARYRPHLFT